MMFKMNAESLSENWYTLRELLRLINDWAALVNAKGGVKNHDDKRI